MPDKAPPPPRPPRGVGREPDPPANSAVRNGEIPGAREEGYEPLDARTTPVPSAPPPADVVGEEKPTNGNLHKEHPAHPGVPLAPPGIVPESHVRTHTPPAAVPPRDHATAAPLGELPRPHGDGRLACVAGAPRAACVCR